MSLTNRSPMASDWIAVGAGLALVRRRRHADHGTGPQVRRIRVKGGYQPAEVHVAAGRPVRLIFCREETIRCSEHVVFPDYGISITLPPFEHVLVELPAGEPGEHAFTCEMQVLRGTLVIGGRRAQPAASSNPQALLTRTS